MKIKGLFPVAAAALVVTSGCSWFGLEEEFRDKGEDYKTASSITPIQVPNGYTTDRMRDVFVIPSVPSQVEFTDEDGDFDVPLPESLDSERDFQRVKIKSLGEDRWVATNVPTAAVWPRVRAWLNGQSVGVTSAVPELGVIETEWLVFNDTPELKDKFEIRIEPGFRAATSEVFVRHMQVSEVPEGEVVFDDANSQAERESWMIDQIANVIASQSDAETVSLLASDIGGKVKSEVVVSSDAPHLVLRVDFDRAWATLAGSIGNDEIEVLGFSREDGKIQISYTPVEDAEEDGWFSGLFSGDELAITPYVLTVSGEDNDVKVNLLDERGAMADAAEARTVLTKVRFQLD